MSKLVAKMFVKALFMGVMSVLAVPFLWVFLRPDQEAAFHFSRANATRLEPARFHEQIQENQYASAAGVIDADRSRLIVGFGDRTLIIRLENYPDEFAIHCPDGPLFDHLKKAYDSQQQQESDFSRFAATFGDEPSLAELLSADDLELKVEHTFAGRIFAASHIDRYRHGDDLRHVSEGVDWYLATGERPSLALLLSGQFGLFCVVVVMATVIGIPSLHVGFDSWYRNRVRRKLAQAPVDAEVVESTSRTDGMGGIVIDRGLLERRATEFMENPHGHEVVAELDMSLWSQYLMLFMLLGGGLCLLPTIIGTRLGAKMLLSGLRFLPFYDMGHRELKAKLRPVIAHVIIAGVNPVQVEAQGAPALLLGSFADDAAASPTEVAFLASKLREIYTDGAGSHDPMEVAMHAFLREGHFSEHRRRPVHEYFAGGRELFLFDAVLDVHQGFNWGGGIMVACLATPGERGKLAQIPWRVISGAVNV